MTDRTICILTFVVLCIAVGSWFVLNDQVLCKRGSIYDTCHIVVPPHEK